MFDLVRGIPKKIARAIAVDLAPAEIKMLRPGEVSPTDLKSIGLLIVGSPIMGGMPTQPMQALLSGIPAGALKDIDVLAFDTRVPAAWVKVFVFAAENDESLRRRGKAAALTL